MTPTPVSRSRSRPRLPARNPLLLILVPPILLLIPLSLRYLTLPNLTTHIFNIPRRESVSISAVKTDVPVVAAAIEPPQPISVVDKAHITPTPVVVVEPSAPSTVVKDETVTALSLTPSSLPPHDPDGKTTTPLNVITSPPSSASNGSVASMSTNATDESKVVVVDAVVPPLLSSTTNESDTAPPSSMSGINSSIVNSSSPLSSANNSVVTPSSSLIISNSSVISPPSPPDEGSPSTPQTNSSSSPSLHDPPSSTIITNDSAVNASIAITPSSTRDTFTERRYDSIFYLKTHKTGSTTVATHLRAYLGRHKLRSISGPGHIFIAKVNPHKERRANAIVGHHMTFNKTVYESYLKKKPQIRLTSVRLPLQRQISWFRQQNKQFEVLTIDGCDVPNKPFLKFFDDWYEHKGMAAQWVSLRESTIAKQLDRNMSAIVDQFSFVFVMERMKDSFECLCHLKGMRLCSKRMPMEQQNVKGTGSCVEQQLTRYRHSKLMSGHELDLLLYEEAGRRLGECSGRVKEECRCPVNT